jgi:glycerate 2-kinase
MRAALGAVDANAAVSKHIALRGTELSIGGYAVASGTNLSVLAIGKAAGGMAEAVTTQLAGRIQAGLVITKDDHAEGYALGDFEIREAGHPVPDARSAEAGRGALAFVEAVRPEGTLLVLLSGGASALVSLPPSAVSVEELATTNQLLLDSGADIRELNAVRKHLSQISGGRLAQHSSAAQVVVLAISDVHGDALDVIGSGPCAPDPTHFGDALTVLAGRDLAGRVPDSVRDYLERGRAGEVDESPKPGAPIFDRVYHRVVASNQDARDAALAEARRLGAETISLGECISGEAKLEGKHFAALALDVCTEVPVCMVAGGESVVRIAGNGRGGRNQELALAAAIELAASQPAATDARDVLLLAVGTDGSDGPTNAAGAWADAGSVVRGAEAGASAAACLQNNDSYSFFAAESGLLVTGPTGTNVMDLVLIWIEPVGNGDEALNILQEGAV